MNEYKHIDLNVTRFGGAGEVRPGERHVKYKNKNLKAKVLRCPMCSEETVIVPDPEESPMADILGVRPEPKWRLWISEDELGGDYLSPFDLFGSHVNSHTAEEVMTKIYRYKDESINWQARFDQAHRMLLTIRDNAPDFWEKFEGSTYGRDFRNKE